MSMIESILSIAAAQIGTKEEPPHSNTVKYNTAFYGKAVSGGIYPWCCAFVWWVFQQAGAGALFYGGKKTASCTVLYNYYRKEGQTVPPQEARPGDLVFFVFDGNDKGTMNHIGICESSSDGYVTTIDGNTGTTSDANGGEVMRRKRALKYVGGVARPRYEEEDDMTEAQVKQLIAEAVKAQEPKVYTTVAEVPEWARPLVQKALDEKVLRGDQAGKLHLTDDNLVTLQMLYNMADFLKTEKV